MDSPCRRLSPPTKEVSGVLDVDNVSFSEPCHHCVTKKRHCLHGGCGQRKKLHLMPLTPTPHPPRASLQRSLSFPVCYASPPEEKPTISRTQSHLLSVGRVNDVLGTEAHVMEAKDGKGEPASPQVGTTPTATSSSDVRGRKEMHHRKVGPSRTRRRLLMQEVEKVKKEGGQNVSPTEKNVQMQTTNLALKEDENGENNPERLTPPSVSPSSQTLETPTLPSMNTMSSRNFLVGTRPEDITRIGIQLPVDEGTSSDQGNDSQATASKPPTSDTDGENYQKRACELLREMDGKLLQLAKMMEELALRHDANIFTADGQPSCHHRPAMADEAATAAMLPPSAIAMSSREAMSGENQELEPSYFVCRCPKCYKFYPA